MNLPNVEVKKYGGDPMTFHEFFAIFDEQVHKTRLTPGQKLIRLLQYTIGDAYKAIAHYAGTGEVGYNEARKVLKKRFGSDLMISDHVIKSIKNGKPVHSPKELQDLADELKTCKTILSKMGRLREIDTQSSIVDIINRLQPYLCNRWKRRAMEFKREKDEYPGFAEFVDFISSEADEAMDPVYGNVGVSKKSQSTSITLSSPASTFMSYIPPQSRQHSCVICNEPHRLFLCETFKRMKPLDRRQLVKDYRLCENCLLNNHDTSQCRKPSVCSVPNCGLKHTKFIHVDVPNVISQSRSSSPVTVNSMNTVYANSCHVDVFVPIVKVELNDKVTTNALLDNASTSTFCTQRLLNKLQLQGKFVNYTLNTISAAEERFGC